VNFRYLVIVAANDDGYGKAGIRGVFPFESRAEADSFAEMVYEQNVAHVMGTGGYPGATISLDLENPDDLDDPHKEYDWLLENMALAVYEDPGATQEDINVLPQGAQVMLKRFQEEDADAPDVPSVPGRVQ
jgi:hypothetical protein